MNVNKNSGKPSIFARLHIRREEEVKTDEKSFLDQYRDILGDQAEVLYRVPYFQWSIHSAAKRMGDENPVCSVFGVGGLASTSIGHMNDYRYLLQNISNVSQEERKRKKLEATYGCDDFDGFLVTGDMTEESKMVVADMFKKMLPPVPEPLVGFSYEFHDDCVKVRKDFQSLVERHKNQEYIPLKKKHEKEILDTDTTKEIRPIVLFTNPKCELDFVIQEMINKRQVRIIDDYINNTFLPWGRDYKNTFTNHAERIITKVIDEVRNSNIDREDNKNCLEVLNNL